MGRFLLVGIYSRTTVALVAGCGAAGAILLAMGSLLADVNWRSPIRAGENRS